MRHRIFNVAARLFLKQGYHETSMREVAEAAGMGKSTLYDYFPSKEEILLYFVEQEMDATHQDAVQIAAMNLPVEEKLRRILGSLWVYLDENREMAVLIDRESSRLGERANQRIASRRENYRKILESVLRQGIQDGIFRSVNPTLAASALHSMMTMPWLEQGEHEDIIETADELIDLFLGGIKVH
ncbi:MAG: TetR/AcrR family transcriptional regulator [Anaerolineaceae bacterium]|nr:MAG: TetR/AcrR family transcriptional regulator [Anaerolineaceae bacterium]